MTDPLTYSMPEVEARLGLRPGQFSHSGRRKRLAEAGFPGHVPGMQARWSRPAVDHWISTNGNTYAPLMQATDDEAAAVAGAAAALEHRYGRGQAA